MELLHVESKEICVRLGDYTVELARSESEVREAQRLRFKVFAEEYGARIPERMAGHDIDHFDAYCDHLLVRDLRSERVVGTYRILTPDAAQRIGSYYSENEFYLTRIAHLRPQMVEVGRSCIHRDYRSGAVIALLWSGLAAYMRRHGYEYLAGCASINMADGGHNAANIYCQIGTEHQAPAEYRVFPIHRLPYEHLANASKTTVPPLLKGYLRAGAWVCGEPAWDPDFNSADLFLLLPMARINERYFRHFMREAGQ
jgi:putative hemolysin